VAGSCYSYAFQTCNCNDVYNACSIANCVGVPSSALQRECQCTSGQSGSSGGGTRDPNNNNNCQWINYSEWSGCSPASASCIQARTRECSCSSGSGNGGYGTGSTGYSSGTDSGIPFSQECGGFAVETQSCPCVRALTREAWKTQTWPENTRTSKFSCNALTWWQLINKSGTLTSWESLAVEYIAANLNTKSGAVPSTVVKNAIDASKNLLETCSWSHSTTYDASKHQAVLNGFNNGNSKYVSGFDTTDEVFATNDVTPTDSEHSSFLLFLIPTIMAIAIIGIVVILIFIKKRYTLIINTEN
jgi:hypothetical protein